MIPTIPHSIDSWKATLPKTLTLQTAQSLKSLLSETFKQKHNVSLDASSVETITTPCIQLIIATGIALENVELRLQISSPSAHMRDAFAIAGLTENLTRLEKE